MKKYFLCWEIEIEAGSAVEACKNALDIQRDETSMATVFTVSKEDSTDLQVVDLSDPDSISAAEGF